MISKSLRKGLGKQLDIREGLEKRKQFHIPVMPPMGLEEAHSLTFRIASVTPTITDTSMAVSLLARLAIAASRRGKCLVASKARWGFALASGTSERKIRSQRSQRSRRGWRGDRDLWGDRDWQSDGDQWSHRDRRGHKGWRSRRELRCFRISVSSWIGSLNIACICLRVMGSLADSRVDTLRWIIRDDILRQARVRYSQCVCICHAPRLWHHDGAADGHQGMEGPGWTRCTDLQLRQ